MTITFADKYQQLVAEIKQLAGQENCQLLVVSKKATLSQIEVLCCLGHQHFAENYLQKAKLKIQALQQYDLQWHFIGQLQTNKLKEIAQHFQWVHSVAKYEHLAGLAKWSSLAQPLNIFIQVNLSHNPFKYGVLPGHLPELIKQVQLFKNLRLQGLMILPEKDSHNDFALLAKLRNELQQRLDIALPELSMGMSQDYPDAIKSGAAWVRIGSLLF